MRIVDLAVKRPVTITMITAAVVLFGLVGLSRLAVNLLPELAYPTLTIRTEYTGAAPAEVEQLVSKPIEEQVGTVKGLRTIQSVSRAEQSDVVLSFAWGTDMDMASLDVREKLDIVELPLDIEPPVLLRFNPSMDPIFRASLTTDKSLTTQQLKAMRTYAEEQLKRQLESLDGVASVRLGGGLEDEVHVNIDMAKAARLNIPPELIEQRLQKENVNLSGGRVETQRHEYLIRTINQFSNLQQIGEVFIARRDGRNIQLKDVAAVEDAFHERDAITRVNGHEAVELSFYKEGDANTVAVAKRITARLNQLQQNLPEGYQLSPTYDQSEFIANAISEVRDAAIFGGLLAMVVIFLFLRQVWPTIVISLSIPLSIIATFNLMYANDISLNIMSLGGIALAVGMLVDNAIVVLENISRYRSQGLSTVEAARQGSKEVAGAITASTLTTMAVFFPLVFVEGIAGQLFSDQALTVTFSLAASLLVAITVIPMLCSRERRQHDAESAEPLFAPREKPASATTRWGKIIRALRWTAVLPFVVIAAIIKALIVAVMALWRALVRAFHVLTQPLVRSFGFAFEYFHNGYQRILSHALNNAWTTLTVIMLVAASSLLLIPGLKVNVLPDMAQGEFYLEVERAPGTTIEQTDQSLQQLAAAISDDHSVARTYSLAGTGSLINASPSQGGDYWGRLNVVMADSATAADQQRVKQRLRDEAQTLPGVSIRVGQAELFSLAQPIVVEISGYQLGPIRQLGLQLQETLQQQSRFTDVQINMSNGQPEIAVYFNHQKLAQLGLSAPDVAQRLAMSIGGKTATKYSLEDRKIDVVVRGDEQQRNSLQDISEWIINPGAQQEVPLSSVADIKTIVGPSEITRIGQQRTVLVKANLAYGDLQQAVTEVQNSIDQLTKIPGVDIRLAGQSEEMQQSFRSLQFALALAVFLVYLVMASQFESLLHPLFILFTVPLAGAGSIIGLAVTDSSLNVMVFIGLIMLAGIVVNNAIVLVDRINQLRQAGSNKLDAVIESASTRFRPIIMTTLTTVLGLIPLAIGVGEGAEIRTPMAITVIFGLSFATLLTLFFIPALYVAVGRRQQGGHA